LTTCAQPTATRPPADPTSAEGPFTFLVPPADLPRALPLVWPFLVRGEDRDDGRSTAEEIWQSIHHGHSQLWLVLSQAGAKTHGICVTSIISYPGLKACDISLCAGDDVKSWIHLLEDDIESWAREQGCEVMEGRFRKGWLRYLPDYQTRRYLVEKELK